MLVDQGIADFYKALIPSWMPSNPQRHRAHVSFVRRIVPPDMSAWGKYAGEKTVFWYSNEILKDETYFWLDVHCQRLMDIRVELGLEPYPPRRDSYHLTIANVK